MKLEFYEVKQQQKRPENKAFCDLAEDNDFCLKCDNEPCLATILSLRNNRYPAFSKIDYRL